MAGSVGGYMLDNGSRVKSRALRSFCERLRLKFLGSTHPYIRIRGRIILGGVEFMHMFVEGQMKVGGIAQPLAYQFYSLSE